jgi:hypothetical protein
MNKREVNAIRAPETAQYVHCVPIILIKGLTAAVVPAPKKQRTRLLAAIAVAGVV